MSRAWAIRLRLVPFAVLPVFLVSAPPSAAADRPFYQEPRQFDYTPGPEDIWKESTVTLPAYPQDSDLLAIPPAPTDTLKVFLDEKSVSLLPDRVLRVTLIVETASGGRNVFYDGIRCETKEYKTYAIGGTERTLQALKGARWQPIVYFPSNAFRYNLLKNYVCDPASNSAYAPREFLRRLKYGN